MAANFEITPAQYSARSLILELFAAFERRLIQVGAEELERPLNKMLKRSEDAYMDNLLRSLNNICDVCLPSVLDALIKWYSQQQKISLSEIGETRDRSVKRTLAASYLFCVTLIEILPQIHYHPHDCEDYAKFIVNTSFSQISNQDPALYINNYNNSLIVADAFAEVIGVLSQSHSKLVQLVFLNRLQGFRRESDNNTNRSIISLLTGIKFFHINTSQVTEFEMGVTFLDELGTYYLEIDLKQKELKHRMAFLLVEILSPVCAQIKMEANIPSLIAFVEKLYGPTYELINKKQHKMAAYPLLTSLLCISQTKFFLSNWVQFLNLTLANLKNKDVKVSRMALESLYRLLWVYIIRNNCENNTATRSRLESICGSLFPRGNRNVIPRNASTPLLIKIIHVIAQQKLDFAFKEIIFDLLGCNRASRSISIYPERMDIGMRALMVIVDGFRQKEGPPEMSRALRKCLIINYSTAPIASCATQRTKKIYLTSPLTAELARQIGLEQYYQQCRKAFDGILRALDTQVGRPYLLTSPQVRGKEYVDIITGEVKPKLDLFRTCVAAIPRLLPDSMSHQSLIEMLIRLLAHVEEELRRTACTTLQNLITECADWREDIIMSLLRFITNSIPDTFPLLLESVEGFFLQLIGTWKSMLFAEKAKIVAGESTSQTESQQVKTQHEQTDTKPPLNKTPNDLIVTYTAHCVEGFAFIMLCQLRAQQKKDAILLLNETRQILSLFGSTEADMISVLEESTPYVVEKYIQHVPIAERQNWPKDFASACDRICQIEVDETLVNQDLGNEYMRWDPWACALSGYCEHRFLPTRCPTAVFFAWSALFNRMSTCYQFVDPSNPQNENRGSLLRSSKSKSMASTLCKDVLNHESYLSLWQKYVVVCCALASQKVFHPLPMTTITSSISSAVSTGIPSMSGSFSPNGSLEMDSLRHHTGSSIGGSVPRTTANFTLVPTMQLSMNASNSSNSLFAGNFSQLFQKIANMVRWDNMTDMRDSVVLGVGSTNPTCFEMLLDELNQRGILREAQDKKIENNVRRRKRKDLLRLQLVRIIGVALFRGVAEFGALIDHQSGQLIPLVHDFIAFIATNIQSDTDRDITILNSMRLHFAKLIRLLICSVTLEKRVSLLSPDLGHSLFMLLFSWSARLLANDKKKEIGACIEHNAIEAMCALSSCRNVFETRRKSDEQYLYQWLETLMSSNNQAAESICEETLCVVLHLNENMPTLFERIIQLCYTEQEIVACRCFRALAMLFSTREYPCEFMTLFVLCQMFSQSPNLAIKDNALQLLHILRRLFLDNALSRCVSMYLPSAPQASIAAQFNVSPHTFTEEADMHSNSVKSPEKAVKTPQKLEKPGDKAPAGRNIRMPDFIPTLSEHAMLQHLSENYSQFTMPIFSEVCSRINDARPNRQSHLLTILLYWVKNVELFDDKCGITYPSATKWKWVIFGQRNNDKIASLSSQLHFIEEPVGTASSSAIIGSEEATQLLLNNMLHLTITLKDRHDVELAALWQCLATSYGNNLPVILHYLWVMVTLSPTSILPIAKKILIYLLNVPTCGGNVIAILVDQLTNSSEPFKATLLRSDIVPYYRWAASPASADSKRTNERKSNERESENETSEKKAESSNSSTIKSPEKDTSVKLNEPIHAKQLPMPPYGGFNAKLSVFLPPTNRPITNLSRDNLALILLCDLIGRDTYEKVDWQQFLPTIIHVSVISLDAKQSIIRWSAGRTILNTCLMASQMAGVNNLSQIANILLNNNLKSDNNVLKQVHGGGIMSLPFADLYRPPRASGPAPACGDSATDSQNCEANAAETSILSANSISVNPPTLIDYRRMLLCDDELFQTPDEILTAIIHCLSKANGEDQSFEMWPYEEVHARNWYIDSANAMSCFVRHLAEYFLSVNSAFVKSWTNVALDLAFRTTNRHFLGRSLHVASALCQPPMAVFVGHILSRLVELLDDGGDEAQNKITDIILYLINVTRFLQLDTSAGVLTSTQRSQQQFSTGHCRSVSCTTALLQQLSNTSKMIEAKSPLKSSPSHRFHNNKKENRHSLLIEHGNVDDPTSQTPSVSANQQSTATMNRSKSATNLNSASASNQQSSEDSFETLSHILCIAVAILDSNTDNTYLLALHLLNQIFVTANTEVTRCLFTLKHISKRLGWLTSTTGLVPLICKGAAYSQGYEIALSLMAECTKILHNSMIVGEQTSNELSDEAQPKNEIDGGDARSRCDEYTKQSFTLIIVTVLPHCMMNFNTPKPVYTHITQAISAQCLRMCDMTSAEGNLENDSESLSNGFNDHPLCNLAMMMDQYRTETFPRDCFQWAKCVIKYLIDALHPNIFNVLLFLTDMLERNDLQLHVYMLHLMNHFVLYGDVSEASSYVINAQIIRTLLKYLQVEQCNKEVSNLLKSFIDQYNISGVAPPNVAMNASLRKPTFDLYDERLDLQGNLNKYRHGTINSGSVDNSLPRRNNTRKLREKLIALLDISGVDVCLHRSASMVSTQSAVNDRVSGENEAELGSDDNADKSSIVLSADVSDLNSSTLPPPPKLKSTAERDVISSQPLIFSSNENISGHSNKNFNETALGSAAQLNNSNGLIDRVSITTDSFPRVFKEFDFLEAEHDSVSESTDSCFNWTSTLRSPRCAYSEDACDDENVCDEHEDEDRDDGDDDEKDESENLPGRSNNFDKRGSLNSRHSNSTQDSPSSERMSLSIAENMSEMSARKTRRISGLITEKIAQQRADELLKSSIGSPTKNLYDYRTRNRSRSSSSASSNRTPVRQSDNESERDLSQNSQLHRSNTAECLTKRSYSSSSLLTDTEQAEAHKASSDQAMKQQKRNSLKRATHSGNGGDGDDVSLENYEKSAAEPLQKEVFKTVKRSGVRRRHRKFMSVKSSKGKFLKKRNQTAETPNSNTEGGREAENPPSKNETNTPVTTQQKIEDRSASKIDEELLDSASTTSGINTASIAGIAENMRSATSSEKFIPRFTRFNNLLRSPFSQRSTQSTLIECNYHLSGQAESMWNVFVPMASNDQTGDIISSLFILFSQILKESGLRMCGFLRDALHIISTIDGQLLRGRPSTTASPSASSSAVYDDQSTVFSTTAHNVLSHVSASTVGAANRMTAQAFCRVPRFTDVYSVSLARAIDVVTNAADSPILFMTPKFLHSSNLLSTMKFVIYELHEHFEVFCERREQCIREIELYKCLHRLIFQFSLMYKKLHDIARKLQHMSHAKDCDLSPAISSLQQELIYHLSQQPATLNARDIGLSTSQMTYASDDIRQWCDFLILNIANKQFGNVFTILHRLRALCGTEFGCCEQTDVESVLLAYCRGHSELRAWALIGGGGSCDTVRDAQSLTSVDKLGAMCDLLREANAQLANHARQFAAGAADCSISPNDGNTGSQIEEPPSATVARKRSSMTPDSVCSFPPEAFYASGGPNLQQSSAEPAMGPCAQDMAGFPLYHAGSVTTPKFAAPGYHSFENSLNFLINPAQSATTATVMQRVNNNDRFMISRYPSNADQTTDVMPAAFEDPVAPPAFNLTDTVNLLSQQQYARPSSTQSLAANLGIGAQTQNVCGTAPNIFFGQRPENTKCTNDETVPLNLNIATSQYK